ncbi:MAG TPA: hypothetical protein VJN18_24855 [Polyangiaceae bacterium]|nr:hypothetical protein [Polyangiaceae bacterium]
MKRRALLVGMLLMSAGAGDARAQVLKGTDTLNKLTDDNLRSSSNALDCLQYPMFSPLYLNTLVGFENTTGTQLGLSKCFSGVGLSAGVTLTSLVLASEYSGAWRAHQRQLSVAEAA